METLTGTELAPSVPGAPDLEWAGDDLSVVWAENDRPVACAAIEKIEAASAQDGRTFSDMNAAATASGATLYGAAFRVKSPASLARKITAKAQTTADRGERAEPAGIAGTVTDVTRYTALSGEHDAIVPAARSTVAELGKRGWTVIEAEHSYVLGNPYKGLHLLIQHNDGQVVEVQIQSERSQELKDRAHELYEVSRDTSRPRPERLAANRENKELYDGLPSPQGLDELVDLGDCPVREKRYT